MNKWMQGFKEINKLDKIILIMISIIFILLCVSIGISISHIQDYSKNRNSGNDRWKEVYDIILDNQQKVDNLENILIQNGLIKK